MKEVIQWRRQEALDEEAELAAAKIAEVYFFSSFYSRLMTMNDQVRAVEREEYKTTREARLQDGYKRKKNFHNINDRKRKQVCNFAMD